MTKRILVCEDEDAIREFVVINLRRAGYDVVDVPNGEEALRVYGENKGEFGLALLDIMMPEVDGYHVLKKLRENNNMPVMILSAKNQDADKILGLDLGADDYLAKPFNPMEAVARINSNIRRFYSLGAEGRKVRQLEVKDLRLDTEECVVYRNGQSIDLTSVEYKMLRMFMEYPGKVFTKQQLYENVWGEEYAIADNNIMVSISRLRAKLSEDGSAYIKTIRGLGYRMEKE